MSNWPGKLFLTKQQYCHAFINFAQKMFAKAKSRVLDNKYVDTSLYVLIVHVFKRDSP